MWEDKRMFFLTGLPRTGTTWLRRTLDAHPEIVCKGEARLISSPFVQGSSLWDDVERGVQSWVTREGSRVGNGFCEPEHEQIAWRQGNPVVTNDFLRSETLLLTEVAMASSIRYLLLRNIVNDEKATGEKTPVIKAGELDRFHFLERAGLEFTLISTKRKFSEWFKSYHKHHMFRWETTAETRDFFPFTKDDYIRAVRGVRDHDKAPGELVTIEQIGKAYEMYRKVNRRLADISELMIPYEELKASLKDWLRTIFLWLDVDHSDEIVNKLATDFKATDGGTGSADASKHTLDEYFRDGELINRLRDIDQMEDWI